MKTTSALLLFSTLTSCQLGPYQDQFTVIISGNDAAIDIVAPVADAGGTDQDSNDATVPLDSNDATVPLDSNDPHVVYGESTCSLTCLRDSSIISCCATARVQGGSFPMGRCAASGSCLNASDSYALGMTNELPEHLAEVDTFYLDVYEVTVGRFKSFVDQFDGTAPPVGAGDHHGLGAGWRADWPLAKSQAELKSNLGCDPTHATWSENVTLYSHNINFPINCVSWYEAFAFCVWDGGRLPTEAEWEYASAGGSQNLLYPWGSTSPSDALAVCNGLSGCTATKLTFVGSKHQGVGWFGHEDLSGNAAEWVFDSFADDWYSNTSCANCANVDPYISDRVNRGGYFLQDNIYLRSAYRYSAAPATRGYNVGFRCAKSK